MRAFSALLIANYAFFLSANAATINNRSISAPTQLCIDDIKAIVPQLVIVQADVSVYTEAAGYPGLMSIFNKDDTLGTLFKKAGTDCCAIISTVSGEESQAVLAAVSTFAPKLTDYLSTIQAKKPRFDKIIFCSSIIKRRIENLDAKAITLDTCLVSSTPSTNLAQINGYVTQIVTAFNSIKSTYASTK